MLFYGLVLAFGQVVLAIRMERTLFYKYRLFLRAEWLTWADRTVQRDSYWSLLADKDSGHKTFSRIVQSGIRP